MRWMLILVAMAAGTPAKAQPITPNECRSMESTISNAAFALRRQVDGYPALAQAMAVVIGKAQARPQLDAAATQTAIQIAHAMAAQERMMRALEDLQHQFRLCSRE